MSILHIFFSVFSFSLELVLRELFDYGVDKLPGMSESSGRGCT